MAGTTTTSYPFKPLFLSRTRLTPLKSLPFSFASLESSICGVHLSTLNILTIVSTRSIHVTAIKARYGGYRPKPSVSRRPRQTREVEPDDDDACLDMTTIRSATVRLIDAEQNMVGVVAKTEAIEMAEEADLDLVILSPDADPPVVRIMDYNKYLYEQQKKKREQQKKSAATRMDIKELKMGYNIDSHDYSVRLRSAEKFLKEGDKVKVMVNLKGREREFKNTAIELMKRFQNDIGELATEESKSFKERTIYMVLVPNKAVLQKAQEQTKKKEKPAVTEIPSGSSAEISTEIPTEIPTEISTEISDEIPSDISDEIPSDISAEIPSDISNEIPTEISNEIPTEIPSEISTESPTEISAGV